MEYKSEPVLLETMSRVARRQATAASTGEKLHAMILLASWGRTLNPVLFDQDGQQLSGECCLCQLFQLPEVIEVVASHCLDQGQKGYLAPFGVDNRRAAAAGRAKVISSKFHLRTVVKVFSACSAEMPG